MTNKKKKDLFLNKKISNRLSYTIISLVALILVAVLVYAAVPNPGHPLDEIAPPNTCSPGEVLQWTGSGWICISVEDESQWITSGNNIYYNKGKVGIGTTDPQALLELNGGDLLLSDAASIDHGMTFIAPTSTFGVLKNFWTIAGGGLGVFGLSDADKTALYLDGYIGVENPMDSTPAILIRGKKKSGWGNQALASTETVLGIQNFATSLVTVLGNGKVGIGTITPEAKLEVVSPTQNAFRLKKTEGVAGSIELFPAVGSSTVRTGTALCQTISSSALCMGQWTSTGSLSACGTSITNGRSLCADFGD